MHKTEEEAARQYDRALIIVKGRLAKTNFPVGDYDREIETFEQLLWQRCASLSRLYLDWDFARSAMPCCHLLRVFYAVFWAF